MAKLRSSQSVRTESIFPFSFVANCAVFVVYFTESNVFPLLSHNYAVFPVIARKTVLACWQRINTFSSSIFLQTTLFSYFASVILSEGSTNSLNGFEWIKRLNF